MRSLALCAWLLVLLLHVTNAIYEEQAGELDWSVQNLGRVVDVAYGGGDKRGTSRAAYVATDSRSRALARIDAKTGEIKWRRVLAAGDVIDSIQLTNYGLLVVSSAGKNVRLWETNEGGMLWDNVAFSGDAQSSSFGGALLVGDDRVLVVGSHAAAFVSLKDGVVGWRATFATAFKAITATALSSDSSTAFVLGTTRTGDTQLVSVEVTTGAITPLELSALSSDATAGVAAFGLQKTESREAVLVAVTSNELTVQALEGSSSKSSVATKAADVVAKGEAFAGLESQITHALVVRLVSGKRLHARIRSSLKVEVSTVISSDGVLSQSLTDETTIFQIAPVASTSSAVQVKSFSFTSAFQGLEWQAEVDVAVHGGSVAGAFVGCPSRKKESSGAATTSTSTPRCRALVVMKDDGLVMTTNDESAVTTSSTGVLWTRDEALANIKEVHWITPAETEIEKQPLKGIPTFVEDLQLDVQRLKHFVEHVVALSSSLFEQKTAASKAAGDADGATSTSIQGKKMKPRQEPLNAHFFGFSKYIVLLTESGRLYAIRAETNTVAWSTFVGADYRLFVTRDHPALGAGAELLLVSSSSKLLWIDGDDGRQVETADASTGSSWVVMLPKRKHSVDEEVSLRRAIAIVSRETLEVTILPKEAAGVAHPEAENFYFSRFDDASGAFQGYTIERTASGTYQARPVWSLVVPADQQLVATSRQRDHSVVDSSVTITGDDSLLLKYLNPHMFGLVTQGSEVLEGEIRRASVLYVSLVDAVTGRVIHRVRHVHGAGPVQIVQSENWVVYSFWNTKEKRTDVVSLALFDGAVGSHSLNPWKRPSWSDSRSSYDPRTPFVLQKSFIFPARIETLGVTVTSRGITPQYILVGMENGQIYKLNRALIDPRQPEKPPTPEEQEEGLHQYTPLIPLYNNLYSMVTYNQSIANLRTIATSPVELESTSLVFAHGLDFFYVRLAPAKAFDVLPQDFNYEQLVLLCVAFFSATYLTKSLVLRKSLNEAWK